MEENEKQKLKLTFLLKEIILRLMIANIYCF